MSSASAAQLGVVVDEQRALTALEAGKHVLVEKLLATMIANGQRMVLTAEQRVWF